MPETWTADGWVITQGSVRDIEMRDGLVVTPEVRGGNLALAGVRGERWRPKILGAGRFVLNVWVGGNNQAEAWAYYEEMLRATVRPDHLVRYERTMPDGSLRYCHGEVLSTVAPKAMGQNGYRVGIEVSVPDGLWYSSETITQDFQLQVLTGQINQVLSMSSFSGGTAALDRLTYRYTGASSDLRITNFTEDIDNGFLRYAGTLPSTGGVFFNSDTWSAVGVGNVSLNQQAVSYSGGRMLSVSAARPGRVPKIRVTVAVTSGSPVLRVVGQKAFLC